METRLCYSNQGARTVVFLFSIAVSQALPKYHVIPLGWHLSLISPATASVVGWFTVQKEYNSSLPLGIFHIRFN